MVITRLLSRLWRIPKPVYQIERVSNVPVVMRDGETLLTDIYHPRGAKRPGTVLMRSPYGRGSLFVPMAKIFAGQGFTTVLQSVRGTFGSSGDFRPFFQERDDGVDTITWIEHQPWYHGKLGLTGASYLGFVQWAVAAELGDRVTAMTTAMTTSDFHASIYEGGGFKLEDYLKWIAGLATQEKTSVLMRVLKERFFGDVIKDAYDGLPLAPLDERATGKLMPFWREWLEHDNPSDPFWEPIKNGLRMSEIKAPVSMVGGWSDLFFSLQAGDFKRMRNLGKQVRLTVGPWTHGNFSGVGAGIRDALDWFDIHLNNRAQAPGDLDRIRVWACGQNEWQTINAWPEHTSDLYMRSSGVLSNDAADTGSLTFTYDPKHPTPSYEGAKLTSKTGRGDMRPLASRSDVLVFEGPILHGPLDLLGDISVQVTTSSSTPHHDLFVCVSDVAPDGTAINITDGYRRLTNKDGRRSRRKTRIETSPVAWRVATGHRLQLIIAAGAFPRFARNLGLGDPLAEGVNAQPVEITVHCGKGASFLTYSSSTR
jgi:putative CocE/NonD family hydrolase